MRLFNKHRQKIEQADQALEQARQELDQTKAEAPRFAALARKMVAIREDNGLADALTHTFRGTR